jgi:RNA recognition motif-containing protein
VLRAGKLNGFGFVQFEAEAGAARACQLLHGADFMGRELTVDGATAAKSGSQQAPAGQPVEGCWFCLSNPKADVNLVASIGDRPPGSTPYKGF